MNIISRFHSLIAFLNNSSLLDAEELFTRKIKEHPGENIILIFANRYGKVRPAIFFPDSTNSSFRFFMYNNGGRNFVKGFFISPDFVSCENFKSLALRFN